MAGCLRLSSLYPHVTMRRIPRGRATWHAVLLVAAVLFLTVACGAAGADNPTPTTAAGPAGPPPPRTVITCSVCPLLAVTRVIDGDTLDTTAGRVRLFGLNTPERGERCFSEATNRLHELAGKTTRVETGPRLEDQFGRLLRYAYTADGNSIDVLLIGEGLARAWTRDGQHRDTLVALEESARQNRAGCL